MRLPFLMEPVQFRKTLDTIAETDAKLFIPSHGKPIAKEKIHASCEVNAIVTLEAETLIDNLRCVPARDLGDMFEIHSPRKSELGARAANIVEDFIY